MRALSQIYALNVFAIIAMTSTIQAQNLTVSGDWNLTIDASGLQSGAGSDLIDTYESVSDQIEIDIQGAGNKNWVVDIKKSDTNWHSDFQFSVRRTSDGSGPGTVSGGTFYQEVTDTDQSFFSGSKGRRDIYVQLRLSGVSIQVPTATYATTIYYTVIEQ